MILKISLATVLASAGAVLADNNLFHEPVRVKVDGKPVASDRPGYAYPTMYDIDGDGLQDLIVSQFMQGNMRFLKNVGKKGAPKFDKIEWINGANNQRLKIPGVF